MKHGFSPKGSTFCNLSREAFYPQDRPELQMINENNHKKETTTQKLEQNLELETLK